MERDLVKRGVNTEYCSTHPTLRRFFIGHAGARLNDRVLGGIEVKKRIESGGIQKWGKRRI